MRTDIPAFNIAWYSKPPAGVNPKAHYLTIWDALDTASERISSDQERSQEKIVIADFWVKTLLQRLPQFVQNPDPVNDSEAIGWLGDRRVILGVTTQATLVLENDHRWAKIQIVHDGSEPAFEPIPGPVVGPEPAPLPATDSASFPVIIETLSLFDEARQENPYLYFELAWTKSTGWCAWLISYEGGVKTKLASGQVDGDEESAKEEACLPVLVKLREILAVSK